jgi:transposase
VPSEYSSGPSTRRGHITKTGNAHLRAQLAWVGLPPSSTAPPSGSSSANATRAWTPRSSPAPDPRSCGGAGALRRLAARKDSKNVVVTAIARELAGFVWAEMTA